MPNRILKESICRSAEIDALSWFEECMFYRLVVNCDDYGRFDGRVRIINSICFPLKNIPDSEVEDALNKLSAVGLINMYTAQGKSVLQLVTWERHQQVRSKRSKYPEPEQMISGDSRCNHMISDDSNCDRTISGDSNCPRKPNQSNPNTNSNSNSNTNTNVHSLQVIKGAQKEPSRSFEANALFEKLWNIYPNKRGKGSVSDAKKKELLAIGEEKMIRAIQRYVDEHNDREKSGTFTPNWQNGSTFFNSGYIDYLDDNYSPAPISVEPPKRSNGVQNFQQSTMNWDEAAEQVMAVQEHMLLSKQALV